MKLKEFPEYLPIEAVDGVTKILSTLIGTLKTHDIFAESKSMADYQETLANLNRDLADCESLYASWRSEAKEIEFRDALAKMSKQLALASQLVGKMSRERIH